MITLPIVYDAYYLLCVYGRYLAFRPYINVKYFSLRDRSCQVPGNIFYV